MSNAERGSWPPGRSKAEHVAIAREWKEAKTESSRRRIFDEHGIRWSELLRLEYWDPTRFALVDTMHNLFLGELKHHCMQVFGMDAVGEKRPRVLASHTPDEQKSFLENIRSALCHAKPSITTLCKVRREYLLAVAQVNGIAVGIEPTKRQIIDALLEWVSLCLYSGSDSPSIRSSSRSRPSRICLPEQTPCAYPNPSTSLRRTFMWRTPRSPTSQDTLYSQAKFSSSSETTYQR